MDKHTLPRQIRQQGKNNYVCFRGKGIMWVLCFWALSCLLVYSLVERHVHLNLSQANVGDSSPVQSTCINENKTPKVALMFLSVDRLHNEPIWRAFFEAAGRLSLIHEPPTSFSASISKILQSPVFNRQATNRVDVKRPVHTEDERVDCSDEMRMIGAEVARLTSRDWSNTDLITRQTLFSVYVNSLAYESQAEPSIFIDSVIEDPVDTSNGYGSFWPVLAALKMIEQALQEPCNRKFVLLSESCIPIHPPDVIHAQLISETQSRISACTKYDYSILRWNAELVDPEEWRKSYQFFALMRSHAQLAVDDEQLQSSFSEYCFTEITSTYWSFCMPEEHFFPTLLAHHGLENETDCTGYVTSENWADSSDFRNPLSYEADVINPDLLRSLADYDVHQEMCEVEQARATTAAIYGGFSLTGCVRRESDLDQDSNAYHWMLKRGYHPLQNSCPLFARQFSSSVVRETLEAALSCNATGLGYWCY